MHKSVVRRRNVKPEKDSIGMSTCSWSPYTTHINGVTHVVEDITSTPVVEPLPRRSKLSQLVPNHLLRYCDRDKFLAIVNQETAASQAKTRLAAAERSVK